MSLTIDSNGPNKLDQQAMVPVLLGLIIGLAISLNGAQVDAVPVQNADDSSTIAPVLDEFTQPDPRPGWIAIEDFGSMHITCYGPDRNGIGGFPLSSHVSRWFGRSRDDTGFTVEEALSWAEDLGLDGICAASPGPSGLYSRHRDDIPAMIEIDGHGRYLVIDRMSSVLWNRLDIWVPDPWTGGTLFSHPCEVREIELQETEVDTYGYF